MNYKLTVLLSMFFTTCLSYKVLLFPLPSGSHVFSFHYIGQELLNRGNEVHVLQHWTSRKPKELKKVDSSGSNIIYHIYGNNSGIKFSMEGEATEMGMKVLNKVYGMDQVMKEMVRFNKNFMKDLFVGNDDLMNHLESLKLDAVVVDYTFFMRVSVVIARRLNLPLISYVDVIEPWLIRTPWLPSIHTPFMPSTDSKSTFYERLINTLLLVKGNLFSPIKDPSNEIPESYKKYGNFTDLKEIIWDSVLFLTTDDPVLNVVRPYTANMISIGGLTTESLKSSSSIPDDYSKFIEDGDNSGVVAVSFGSMVPRYPEHLATIFLQAFTRLPQYKFIWRFENYLNFTIPKNVKVVKWLAQNELLGHSSVKLFITHSGNNGQFEALYHGVPMLAVPLLGDQPRNARRIVERGFGEEMDFRTLEVEQMINLIQKIIEDPSYKRRIMKASEIFKSRPDTPGERAAFWIEHVIKFGGDHLKPAGNELSFWQYMCLDVLLVFQVVLVILVCIVVFMIYGLYRLGKRLFSSNSNPKKIKTK